MKIIPLAAVILMLLITTIDWVLNDFEIGVRLGVGYLIGVLAAILYFINHRISNFILGFGLLLATINVIAFTNYFIKIGAGLAILSGKVELSLQLLPLVIFIFFLSLHWRSIKGWINKDGL